MKYKMFFSSVRNELQKIMLVELSDIWLIFDDRDMSCEIKIQFTIPRKTFAFKFPYLVYNTITPNELSQYIKYKIEMQINQGGKDE